MAIGASDDGRRRVASSAILASPTTRKMLGARAVVEQQLRKIVVEVRFELTMYF
jgi:hypothetical protein